MSTFGCRLRNCQPVCALAVPGGSGRRSVGLCHGRWVAERAGEREQAGGDAIVGGTSATAPHQAAPSRLAVSSAW